jgi:hypothetical protein
MPATSETAHHGVLRRRRCEAGAACETSKRYPLSTLWNTVYLPSIQAAVELGRNQPEKAVELLRSATPYERAHPYAMYLRGLAYLRARNACQDSLALWKDADPDIPILKEAKQEYAKLK